MKREARYAVTYEAFQDFAGYYEQIAWFPTLDKAARFAVGVSKPRIFGLRPEYEVHVSTTLKEDSL